MSETMTESLTHSEQINELAAALAKAQAEMKGALKDSTNPHFNSKYAGLDSAWEACRPALTAAGLSVVQAPMADGSTVGMTTMLLHASGQWMRSTLTMTARDASPQAIGSIITYARRYGLCSMAGIAPEDDDDANAAQGTPAPAAKKPWGRQELTPEQRVAAIAKAPYAGREAAKIIDKTTGEVTRAKDEDWVESSWAEIVARRAALPAALQAVIPDDPSMHSIPPKDATDEVPFMIDAIIRKAEERKIDTKEWAEIMERFFGSKRARLLNNDKKPVSKINPFFVRALYLDMDMAR